LKPTCLIHFVQADLVDLVRAQVGGGEFDDLRLVIRFTVRQVLRRQRDLGLGDVFLAHELQQFGVRRDHLVADRLQRLGAQCFLLGRRDHGRHLPERLEEHHVFRPGFRDGGDRLVAAFQRHLGRGEAACQAGAHIGNLFTEIARHVVQLGHVVAVIVRGAEGLARFAGHIGPERRVGVQGFFVFAEALVIQQRRDLCAVHLVVDALLGRKLFGLDAFELAQRVFPALLALHLGGRVHPWQLAVDAAHIVFVVFQALLLAPFPFGLVDGGEAGIRTTGLGGCKRWGTEGCCDGECCD
jgi:hypothetical protein